MTPLGQVVVQVTGITNGDKMDQFNRTLSSMPNLDAMIDAALDSGREAQEYDFKRTLDLKITDHKVKLVKAVAAFGNSEAGGALIIGVNDNREIVGLENEIYLQFDQTRISELIASHLAPVPEVHAHQLEYTGRRKAHHGVKLVVIDTQGFERMPFVTRSSLGDGKARLTPGVIYVRTRAAQAAPLQSETEMERLCQAIVSRHAEGFTQIIRRGLNAVNSELPDPARVTVPSHDMQEEIRRAHLDNVVPGVAALELFSAIPGQEILNVETMREVIDNVRLDADGHSEAFPFTDVAIGNRIENFAQLDQNAWIGRVPSELECDPKYLWILSRNAEFYYRELLWESNSERFQTSVGLLHVLGSLVRLIKFQCRLLEYLEIQSDMKVVLGASLVNIMDRNLINELDTVELHVFSRHRARKNRVEAKVSTEAQKVISNPKEIVLSLTEELTLGFARHDLTRPHLSTLLERAGTHLGPQQVLD